MDEQIEAGVARGIDQRERQEGPVGRLIEMNMAMQVAPAQGIAHEVGDVARMQVAASVGAGVALAGKSKDGREIVRSIGSQVLNLEDRRGKHRVSVWPAWG
jgi:hypothetical protein